MATVLWLLLTLVAGFYLLMRGADHLVGIVIVSRRMIVGIGIVLDTIIITISYVSRHHSRCILISIVHRAGASKQSHKGSRGPVERRLLST